MAKSALFATSLVMAMLASGFAGAFPVPMPATMPVHEGTAVILVQGTKVLRNLDPTALKGLDLKPVKPRLPGVTGVPSAGLPAAPSVPKIPVTRPRAGGLGTVAAPPPVRNLPGGFVRGVVPTTPRGLDPGAVVIGSKEVRKAKRFAALRAKLPPLTVKNVAIGAGITAFIALQFVPAIVISNIDLTDDPEDATANAQ